jgi:hypothetical protein
MSCLIGILVAFSLLTTSSFADQAGELEPRTHGVGQEAILQPEGQPLDAEGYCRCWWWIIRTSLPAA